jgi:hypothetical protein
MTRPKGRGTARTAATPAVAATAAAAVMLAAGCSSPAPATTGESPVRTAATSLNASVATDAGTWAVVVMGGSSAQHNNFWQLFTRPADGTAWKLVTPPGTADNGGLVVAADGGQSLITAFRPSQDLTYTPLIETGDSGQAWSSAGPLDAALASTPDSLAAEPGGARVLALTTGGTAELAAPGYTAWSTVASVRTLAATPAGRRCRPQGLTAAAFTSSGTLLLGAACGRPGAAGIFASQNGTWQAAGPALPAAAARQDVTVLRLTQTPGGIAALLDTGTSLLAAWLAGNGSWTLSPPLRLGGVAPASVSFGPGGAAGIILSGRRGVTIAPGGQWHPLPALPAGTMALAPDSGAQISALAVHSTTLTVWQLHPGTTFWEKVQVISVPILFGSSD